MNKSLTLDPDQYIEHERIYIAYSGGIDSHVLLHLAANTEGLKEKISALHINHQLSTDANHWQTHCQQQATLLNIPFEAYAVTVKKTSDDGLEQAARVARFMVFENILNANYALFLAHHNQDLTETLLLQLMKGAGIDGLAGIPQQRPLNKGQLYRPLLFIDKKNISIYASKHRLHFVNDKSNTDTQFDRNYIRHELLPIMKKRWPNTVNNIVRSAKHCQKAKQYIQKNIKEKSKRCITHYQLHLDALKKLTEYEQTLVIRDWLRLFFLVPSDNVLNQLLLLINAKQDAAPLIQLKQYHIRRYRQNLYIFKPIAVPSTLQWQDTSQFLTLPNNLGVLSLTKTEQKGFYFPTDKSLHIHFRQGGESFLLNGQQQKLKKLFQAHGVPPWLRHLWPLLYLDNQLIAVPIIGVNDAFSHSAKTPRFRLSWQAPPLIKDIIETI